jgi:transposase
MNRVEIVTSTEKRRYWTRAEKERWVSALMEPDANASDVARRAGVSTSLLYRWRQQLAASRNVPSFVPVTIAPDPPDRQSAPATITIEFGAGVRMRIEGAPDAETLTKVIGALSTIERRR